MHASKISEVQKYNMFSNSVCVIIVTLTFVRHLIFSGESRTSTSIKCKWTFIINMHILYTNNLQ